MDEIVKFHAIFVKKRNFHAYRDTAKPAVDDERLRLPIKDWARYITLS
jgi:hypothetical protein